jgi:hypothetical protein
MPSGVALDNSMGAYLIALLLSTTIYGVTCLQVYTYFTESVAEDPVVLKAFVRDRYFLPGSHYSCSVSDVGIFAHVILRFA